MRAYDARELIRPMVRSLRSLDRAHSSVMGVVYVSNLESGTVTGQTARSKGGKTSLVRQLSKWVILIHELGQLGRSEELFDCSCNRFDIDQGLRRNSVDVLCCHSFAYHTLHTGQTDAVLVLKQLTYGTDSTVAQVVDIIGISCAVFQMHVVVDGSENIFLCDMFRNQVVNVTFDRLFDLFDIGIFLQDLFPEPDSILSR